MEQTAAASGDDIRHSHSLNDGENEYVSKRKENIILKSFQKLDIKCPKSVPHIALLGSGGGERALVAMLGSIDQLVKEDLFNTLLYIGGVSGSTWAMSSLYHEPHFEPDMDKIISKMFGPGVPLSQIMDWLDNVSKEETFSLTDFWAVIISALIMKQLEPGHLSEVAKTNGLNPYPIYSTVEREHTTDKPEKGHWFEISPHESGFSDLDLFIETSLLGSEFNDGHLQKEMAEMDMVKLQGICGSALADWKTIRNTIINQFFRDTEARFEDTTQVHHCIYLAVDHTINMIGGNIEDPAVLEDLDKLQQELKEIVYDNSNQLKTFSLEERQNISQEKSRLLLQEMEKFTEKSRTVSGSTWQLSRRLFKLLSHLIQKWEWGNTRNFLYNYKDSSVPSGMCSEKINYLIDAGLWMNVPYPPFLGDKRDIDLIIAPDFSAGEIFETLTLAQEYAKDKGKPFPMIDNEILEKDRKWPKDCYVFKGKGMEPTIIYIPLFNKVNCKDEKDLNKKMEEFSTFQWAYKKAKIEKLLDIARDNIKRNRNILLEEIKEAISRRKSRIQT